MQLPQHRYFILNKPFNMVSQFVSTHNVRLLRDINFIFPEGTHAIGRLDNHSEGLLILSTNKKVTRLLFQGVQPHKRTYLVLVNKIVNEESLNLLRNGVEFIIQGGNKYKTAPCEVSIITNPPINFNSPYKMIDKIPYTWLSISLTEGKFHQVRKMVSAIHHKVKRLIRINIENLHLADLQPGEVKEIEEKAFFELLNIKY